MAAVGLWARVEKDLKPYLDPIWGAICLFHVKVAVPVGKRLMSPVLEQMTRDAPCIDLASRTDKLNEHVMAIGNTQLIFQP